MHKEKWLIIIFDIRRSFFFFFFSSIIKIQGKETVKEVILLTRVPVSIVINIARVHGLDEIVEIVYWKEHTAPQTDPNSNNRILRSEKPTRHSSYNWNDWERCVEYELENKDFTITVATVKFRNNANHILNQILTQRRNS